MFDKNLFKYYAARAGKNLYEIAVFMQINEATLHRKMNGTSDFTREEIQKIKQFLALSDKETMQVFFA